MQMPSYCRYDCLLHLFLTNILSYNSVSYRVVFTEKSKLDAILTTDNQS